MNGFIKPPKAIIGKTETGRDIYNACTYQEHKDFSVLDHFDARMAHIARMKEIDKTRDHEGYTNNQNLDNAYNWHWLQYDAHQRKGQQMIKKAFA